MPSTCPHGAGGCHCWRCLQYSRVGGKNWVHKKIWILKWPKLWCMRRRWEYHMFCKWVERDVCWWSGCCAIFTPKQVEQAWVAATVCTLGCMFCFVIGIVAFLSPHSNTKVDNTAAALESSASTLCGCCNVSTKRTTLAGFCAARDTAMLLSDVLAMSVQRRNHNA